MELKKFFQSSVPPLRHPRFFSLIIQWRPLRQRIQENITSLLPLTAIRYDKRFSRYELLFFSLSPCGTSHTTLPLSLPSSLLSCEVSVPRNGAHASAHRPSLSPARPHIPSVAARWKFRPPLLDGSSRAKRPARGARPLASAFRRWDVMGISLQTDN